MFRIANGTQTTIWAMFEWRRPNCPDGGDWEKKGWWMIPPGQSKVVYGGDLVPLQACSYYYAHGANGAQWAGPITEFVPSTAFDWCANTSSTDARRVGMREICTGNFNNYTLTLTP
ncbi:uncharacterized protein DUF1036 [Edaphobacter aggregans]|uniref:Uncharacterized protein DUF1036 n=1 Tax=Edaphobacter aggregans TaxID=570835 RepID=A0A428MJY7_9BACT|nr:DUF1036 domain-containing protein [Edaphobacter aggregans]RSL17228.1 uncharacterized protein DUF1036 [Edaphobacter aggregans]